MGLSFVYIFQKKIIFQSKKLAAESTFQFNNPFEEFFLETADGEQLNAVHFKNENPKGIILYFHGNRGNLSRWGVITSFFARKEYDVIVMDYRGYGKSTGEITEKKLYNDAQLFYEYVLTKYPEDKIILYGRSLGTGIAIKIASINKPGNLILETPYNTMEEVTRHWLPIFPVKKLLKFKFPSKDFIKKVSCPVTIYHGTDDRVVPYASGMKLYNGIPATNKEMISVEGGSHNNLIHFDEYTTTIDRILKK